VCRYYAENAGTFLAPEAITTEASGSRVIYQPLGVLLAVMPWNFPFWQFFRFAAPALMAGNTVLLKHASNVPRSALELEAILLRAGFPEGVMQTLLIGSGNVAGVISDDRVAAVTLTGSTEAGRAVAVNAAGAIKKSVLELGGSDPFIVMPSADLERAVSTAVTARTINNGQSCIAAKRFIVHRDIADAFLQQFTEQMSALRVGDPRDEATQIGPMATEAMRDEVVRQVRDTVSAGARVLTGGNPIDRTGWFFEPTVLTDIPEGSPAHRDEIFGPVASVFVAENAEDAVRIANDSPFGLAAAVWTTNSVEKDLFIDQLETGTVVINRMVASDPRLPFGGIKISGYGRELGPHGIREFVNCKTVVVDT
jgi:succinate-semialdehyde dehydrogenase/glutarate-semialdehyde dehydrogenase